MRRVLALAFLLALATGSEAAPAAPGFKVRLIDGKTSIDSRDLIGKKILVLRFQASYCKPCAKESPALGRLFDKYKSRDVEVLALHVEDTAADTRAFVRKYKVTYPVALDPKLTIGNTFGFKGTPYTVVIDRQGEMVSRVHGVSAVGRLPRLLDDLLKKEPPPA
jgi:peroxiredoxin